MTVKDLLGLILRVTGLGFIIFGIMDLGHLLLVGLGFQSISQYPAATVAVGAGFWFVLGLLVVLTADVVVSLVYRRN